MASEVTINLGCAKINIKRSKNSYCVPPDVINPKILNPLQYVHKDTKTYKLSPSVTLFFKKTGCFKYSLGISTKKIAYVKSKRGINKMFKDKIKEMSARLNTDCRVKIYDECWKEMTEGYRYNYFQIFHSKYQALRFYFLRKERDQLGKKYYVYPGDICSSSSLVTNNLILDKFETKIRKAQKKKMLWEQKSLIGKVGFTLQNAKQKIQEDNHNKLSFIAQAGLFLFGGNPKPRVNPSPTAPHNPEVTENPVTVYNINNTNVTFGCGIL